MERNCHEIPNSRRLATIPYWLPAAFSRNLWCWFDLIFPASPRSSTSELIDLQKRWVRFDTKKLMEFSSTVLEKDQAINTHFMFTLISFQMGFTQRPIGWRHLPDPPEKNHQLQPPAATDSMRQRRQATLLGLPRGNTASQSFVKPLLHKNNKHNII